MVTINKVINLRIVSITLYTILLSTSELYSFPFSKDNLRLPIGTEDDTYEDMEGYLKRMEGGEDKGTGGKISRRAFLRETAISVGASILFGKYSFQKKVAAEERKGLELETGQIRVWRDHFVLNDKPVYLVAVNYNCFWESREVLDLEFKKMSQIGVRVIRIQLANGLREGGVFDWGGDLVGIFDDKLSRQTQIVLDAARNHNLQVQFVLTHGNEFRSLVRPKIIVGETAEDRKMKKEFFRDFIGLFLTEYGDDPAIFGFEVMAMPEEIIDKADGGLWEMGNVLNNAGNPVPLEILKEFIEDICKIIRSKTRGKLVTLSISVGHDRLFKLFEELPLDYYSIVWWPLGGDVQTCLNHAQHLKSRPLSFVGMVTTRWLGEWEVDRVKLYPDQVHNIILDNGFDGAVTQWDYTFEGDVSFVLDQEIGRNRLGKWVKENHRLTRNILPRKPTTWGDIKERSVNSQSPNPILHSDINSMLKKGGMIGILSSI